MVKKLLAVIMAAALVLSCCVFTSSAASTVMRFNSDGKFKIVVFADCQDDEDPSAQMLDFMGFALDKEKPDLVVFTGDNVHVSTNAKFKTGLTKLMQPLIQRDIPYAYTYGNHDADSGVTKEYQYSVYKTLGTCLTYNADSSIYGYGNCNIPIYSSTGNDMAFNLWIIDSNMYSGSGYDNVHADQLNWFKRTDEAIEAQYGHKVNSLVFQHIVVPEVYNCLVESSSGSKTYNGKKYALQLNSNAHGYLGEFPCPPETNSGEFTTLKNRGDVLGIVTGHDHSNSFVGTYQGIDFIQMPGMTFQSYGDANCRGYGVIELDEHDTSTYLSHTVRYVDRFAEELVEKEFTNNNYYCYTPGTTYISEVMCAQNESSSTAKNSLTSKGFTVIDYDLNKGARGQYIFMGYKTTKNYADAIKDIRFYSEGDDFGASSVNISINGVPCTYKVDTTDLNKGSGGDYIYTCYTKNGQAGPAITSVSFGTTTSGTGVTAGSLLHPETPADLNNGTNTHENGVYCYMNTNVQTVDAGKAAQLISKYAQLEDYLSDTSFTKVSRNQFSADMSAASGVINSLNTYRASEKNTSGLAALTSSIVDSCGSLVRTGTENNLFWGIEKPSTASEITCLFNIDYANISAVPTSKYMGTGSTVTLRFDGVTKTYTAVVFGDVNGDAWYDGQDAVIVNCLAIGKLTKSDVGEAAYKAADCNHDGVVNSSDVLILEQAGVLLESVDQEKSIDELMETAAFNEYLNLISQNEPAEEEQNTDCCIVRFFKNVLSYLKEFFEKVEAFIFVKIF